LNSPLQVRRGDVGPTKGRQNIRFRATGIPPWDRRQRNHHANGHDAEKENQQVLLYRFPISSEESIHESSSTSPKTSLL
jgi:hypothetical protein